MIQKAKLKTLGAVAALVLSGSAYAQYPTHAITMIVPFPPGGVADTVARPIADAMSRDLGQPVVIENKAGSGGGLGMGEAARAKPDGYTILLTLSSISILPEADKILGRKSAYELNQFKPIARLTADPTVLVVRADAPWNTAKDLVDAAKKSPGTINYGSSGIYGSMHVPMAMLDNAAGIKMTHVPYTGAGPAVAALLGGQVQAISTGPSSIVQYIKAGRVKALAHWGDKPLTSLPDVPSLESLGYNAQFVQWSGIFVPAATPKEAVDRLRASVKKIANDPAVQAKILGSGSPIEYMDNPEFQKYWDKDAAALTKAVKAIGKID